MRSYPGVGSYHRGVYTPPVVAMSPRYELQPILVAMGACQGARDWLREAARPDGAAAWAAMPRGDWMLWIAARSGVDRRLVVLAACDCAEPALVHVPAGEDRPRLAIETARRWARGEATIEEVRAAAAAAAWAAAWAAAAATAAAWAAEAATTAAAWAAEAAAAAAEAAAAEAARAAAEARTASLARSADLVRERIPYAAVEAAMIAYARKHWCLVEIGGGR